MSTSVLFVCLGNICRSPTADGVFRELVKREKLDHRIRVDSAGTAGWHQGRQPDPRTVSVAKQRGYDLSVLRARQLVVEDFDEFDYILAMDKQNLKDINTMRPAHFAGHTGLFLDFAPSLGYREVPDPYYGEADDFALVVDLVEGAAQGLLEHLRNSNNL